MQVAGAVPHGRPKRRRSPRMERMGMSDMARGPGVTTWEECLAIERSDSC